MHARTFATMYEGYLATGHTTPARFVIDQLRTERSRIETSSEAHSTEAIVQLDAYASSHGFEWNGHEGQILDFLNGLASEFENHQFGVLVHVSNLAGGLADFLKDHTPVAAR